MTDPLLSAELQREGITVYESDADCNVTQTADLLANLHGVSAAASRLQTLLAQLSVQLSTLFAAQAALAAAQNVINGITAALAAGQTLTPADQANLMAAQAAVTTQTAIIAQSSAAATSLINQIKSITIPSNFQP